MARHSVAILCNLPYFTFRLIVCRLLTWVLTQVLVLIASQIAGWAFFMTSSVAHPVVVALSRLMAAWSMSGPCSSSAWLSSALPCNLSFLSQTALARSSPTSFSGPFLSCVIYLASDTLAGKLELSFEWTLFMKMSGKGNPYNEGNCLILK